MKESKAVYVTKKDFRENLLHRNYQLYSNRVYVNKFESRYDEVSSRNIGVQYNSKRDNLICTCKNVTAPRKHQQATYFNNSPKQIYTYRRSRSFTDIGVGSVKAFQKKKVKRIYLPETDDRGVGSSDLSTVLGRRIKYQKASSYYEHKQTSSKCVGGVIQITTECVVSAKISPIIQTKSRSTSPRIQLPIENTTNTEIGSNTVETKHITTTTQIETNDIKDFKKDEKENIEIVPLLPMNQVSHQPSLEIMHSEPTKSPAAAVINAQPGRKLKVEKSFSSDSLVQHVHNLENPSVVKSIDPMENKLEREYRRIFTTTSKDQKQSSSTEKTISDFKSPSVLRRRFDALRRSLGKKDDSRKNINVENKLSSHESNMSRRDASVTSDPPSLEGRSYSNTKPYKYSPYTTSVNPRSNAQEQKMVYKKSYTGRKDDSSSGQWSRANVIDSEYGEGVKGMFKLWGKKFNLDDDYKEDISPKHSYKEPKTAEIEKSDNVDKTETIKTDVKLSPEEKKVDEGKKGIKKEEKGGEKKKFFFFRKKSKDKTKATKPPKDNCKPNKGVTAGRCELRDGLTIKIGAANVSYPSVADKKKVENPPEAYEEMLRKAWLMKYLTNPIESANSLNVRWNNQMYATSSSTVFELMENVYKETGVVFKSKSELITDESSYYKSSYYKSYTKQNINFVQNVEAWMIPKIIPDQTMMLPNLANEKTKEDTEEKDMEATISNRKWVIEKSKAFAHKIEVVLHSSDLIKLRNPKPNSEYLRIDIPKGFFSDTTSSDEPQVSQTSDEEVYKIVEYETPISNADTKFIKKFDNLLHMEDHKSQDIKVTISVKDNKHLESKIMETIIKRPPLHRDVMIQGSNVYIPKKCDVIGVGIITQRDKREPRKPILKIVEYVTDDDTDHSVHSVPKKCEFAESYLQDYYRHCIPLGTDSLTWCVSDSHLKCCSNYNSRTSLNNGDGCKSCPNIQDCDDQSPAGSCTSSCSSCRHSADRETDLQTESRKTALYKIEKEDNKKDKNKKTKPGPDDPLTRVLPKDSLEVFKKRKIYATSSNKANWNSTKNPSSRTSLDEAGGVPDTKIECPKPKSIRKPPSSKALFHKKPLNKKKHVSLPGCEALSGYLEKQLAEGPPTGILYKKGAGASKDQGSKKHASVSPIEASDISEPACKPFCMEDKNAECDKKNSSQTVCTKKISSQTVCPKQISSQTVHAKKNSPQTVHAKKNLPQAVHTKMNTSQTVSPKNNSPRRLYPKKNSSQTMSPKKNSSESVYPNKKSSQTVHAKKNTFQSSPELTKKTGCCRDRDPTLPCWDFSGTSSSSTAKSPPGPPSPPKDYMSGASSPSSLSSPTYAPSPTHAPSPTYAPSRHSAAPLPSQPVLPPKKPKKKKDVHCNLSPCKDVKPKTPTAAASPKAPKKKEKCSTQPCTMPLPNCMGCATSPCNLVRQAFSQEFPWHTENQHSSDTSLDKQYSPTVDCIKQCPFQNLIVPRKPKDCKKGCTQIPSSMEVNKGQPSADLNKPKPPGDFNKSKPPFDLNKPKPPCDRNKPEPPCMDKSKRYPPAPRTTQVGPPDSVLRPGELLPKPIPPPPNSSECPMTCITRSKYSGIKVQIKPSKKKTCDPDCLAWDQSRGQGVIRLNSNERITIKMKEQTPSTEEIREALGIKIQGDDGRVLVERRNFNGNPTWCQNSGDNIMYHVYKDPNIHRVSTPINVNRAETDKKSKSDTSFANLIEINFKLKINKGDKTTEINIGKDGDSEKVNQEKKIHDKTPQDVFVMNEEKPELSGEEQNPKNDINIRILIKTYKPKHDKENLSEKCIMNHEIDKDYSRKITDKFHTVSTGENPINLTEENHEMSRIWSIHRATIDLSSSVENTNTSYKPSDSKIMTTDLFTKGSSKKAVFMQDVSLQLSHIAIVTRNISQQLSNRSVKESISPKSSKTYVKDTASSEASKKVVVRKIDLKNSDVELKTSKSGSKPSESKTAESNKELIKWYDRQSITHLSLTDTDEQDHSLAICKTSTELGNKTSDDPDTDLMKMSDEPKLISNKITSKDMKHKESKKSRFKERKELLKQVFENANCLKKPKNKNRMKKIKDMLKAILTSDSSEQEDLVATSNELAKELTCASIKPNLFKNSDSLNNYYKCESALDSGKCSNHGRHPSIENNSADSDEWSNGESPKLLPQGCVCSTLADRLKQCNMNVGGGCCCNKKMTSEQETNCDIRNDDDYFLLNYKNPQYADVETQNSRYLSTRINAQVSAGSKAESCFVEDIPTTLIAQIHEHAEETVDNTCTKEETTEVADNFANNAVKKKVSTTETDSKTKANHVKQLNQKTKLGILDDDKIVFLETKSTTIREYSGTKCDFVVSEQSERRNERLRHHNESQSYARPTDVLQLYETKKAVLEIYAKKIVTDEGEHIVATLPKFVYDKENEIRRNYEEIVLNSYKTTSSSFKRNIVMMSIGR